MEHTEHAAIEAELSDHGVLLPERLADLVHTTVADLARTAGLDIDDLSLRDRVRSATVQSRLMDLARSVDYMSHDAGSPSAAYGWFRAHPLPSYADPH